ncbi:tetratricopeptide repeat protein [Vibrio sp. SS-MA-C1-2]|uniref:SirB1 family protein n=1 Tax=Vibrio sp. SS-MA-C1-2 TaxID=2908646 RepID=UPI001F16B59C|nr:tetratricopeptide repeat protein [Vibrio sp. SS-MA-C1-2]UJF18800.1 tetratricopeptide repeat protein [Vibrio sp. SS-MA-C1-2]
MFDFDNDELDNMSLVDAGLAVSAEIKSSLSQSIVKRELAQLVEEAEQKLLTISDKSEQLEGLIELFYREWGFTGDYQEYFKSENIFLDSVIERRRGIPVTLGAIFLYLTEKLDLPVQAVNFPTQLILRVNIPGKSASFINPFDGNVITSHLLEAWLKGHEGAFAKVTSAHLHPSSNSSIISRWLGVMKNILLGEHQFDLALRCSDLALILNPDDPYEIRDRGFIFQQLDCNHIAASDFEYFIEQCPDDPSIEILRLQLKALSEQGVVLH